MKISGWMKCSFLMAFLTLMIVSTASQLNASVNTSGTYQDAGVMMLFAQDTGSDSTIMLAHYTGWRHRHGYRGYGPPPPPPYRLHRR